MTYEDALHIERSGSGYTVRDYYGAIVYRAADRQEAEAVLLWAWAQENA